MQSSLQPATRFALCIQEELYEPSENPLRINKRRISRDERFLLVTSQADNQAPSKGQSCGITAHAM
jgi:hypothetical protein